MIFFFYNPPTGSKSQTAAENANNCSTEKATVFDLARIFNTFNPGVPYFHETVGDKFLKKEFIFQVQNVASGQGITTYNIYKRVAAGF